MHLWNFFDNLRNSIDLAVSRKLASLNSLQKAMFTSTIQTDWSYMIDKIGLYEKEAKFNLAMLKLPRLSKQELESHFCKKEGIIANLVNKMTSLQEGKFTPQILKEIQTNIDNIYYNGIVKKEHQMLLNKTCFFLSYIEDDIIFKACNHETSFGKLVVLNKYIDRRSVDSILYTHILHYNFFI